MVPKLVKPDVHQDVAEVFAIVVEEVVVDVAVAAVEVEVAPGLQLVKPPSSSLAASHRLRRPTSPQTHSHSLGENLTLVVRTKMKWELDSVFQKQVHDLENQPLLKIWLS